MKAILQSLIDYFPDLLDVSMTAGIVILFVICARLLLRRVPKIFSYALWAVVLLRLLVPISVESPVSVIPEPPTISNRVEVNEVLPEVEFETPKDQEGNAWHAENTLPGEPMVQTSTTIPAETYIASAWLLGIAIMVLYSIISYWQLRKKVQVAIAIHKGIYLADDIATPFVMGIFQPTIYLPATLEETERKYIIAHEQHHIRRGDHIFKALGFLALTIHWFNPLVWVAFVLAGRDMEMSCDEAVIRKLGADIRADYSASLLNLATGHRLFSITPLAFGEGNPTKRVRNLANWKKSTLWVIVLCVILCSVLAVCLLTDPPEEDGMIVANGIVYHKSDAESDALPRGSKEIGRLMGIKSDVSAEEPFDFYGINLKKRYIGMPIFQSGTDVNTIYLVAGGDGFLPFTNEEITEATEPQATEPQITEPIEANDWGISLALHGASSYGAGWYFINNGTATGELTYDRYFSLEQLADGTWSAPNELVGADLEGHIFDVEDGIGWYVEWPEPIGYLTDGHYRFGKKVKQTYVDGTSEERMFYFEFSLQNGVIPLEDLPENYPYANFGNQPVYDGCFTQSDGRAMSNKQFFKEFADITQGDTPSFIRIVNSYYGKKDHYTVHDLEFDGSQYTISWMEDGIRQSKQYRYLKHFTGDKEDGYSVGYDYDVFEHLVLVNDDTVTWTDVRDNNLDCMFVYSDYIYYYDRHYESAELPGGIEQADLVFEGETLLTVTDSDRLEDIYNLFDTAEILSSEPKTHSIGVNLHLVLTFQGGETVTIELDPDNDICRMDGSYIHYGRYDEPSYIHALWQYLDIPAWPDVIYAKYPGAYRS